MAGITRYSPWDEAFDELFRGFFVRPIGFESGRAAAAPFRVDVTENESSYTLLAELPGVKKEDINVTIDGDTVAISAEVKQEKDVKNGGQVLRSERYYGKLYRAFTLGQAVDESSAQAKYTNGVLELTLPKKAAVQAKRITVQ
ncbi:MAG TPA: Hsp20/alpha crystallin family protein [Burkholderiales bacterium]|nr:Hsp20/alpha crystallin family protein [Burkholderiales bacterium]